MTAERKLTTFAKYAWFVVGYNLLVILWGVFLRASRSGDGCGQHWLTCHGEVVPSAPELKTVIEFSHRITSALDGLIVLTLFIWAYFIWKKARTSETSYVFAAAAGSFLFVLIEGALGAGLVLTGNTAETLTPARPFWMAAHLINTLILLTLLTLTAWSSSTGKRAVFAGAQKWWIILGAVLIFFIGTSGSIAALSSMIFPSGSIAEGIAKDFSPTSHILLRLRPLHPIVAVAASVFLIFWAGWIKNRFTDTKDVVRWANVLSALLIAELIFGALTLLSLGPILMQLGHLLLADMVWISFVLMSANILSQDELGIDYPAGFLPDNKNGPHLA